MLILDINVFNRECWFVNIGFVNNIFVNNIIVYRHRWRRLEQVGGVVTMLSHVWKGSAVSNAHV